MGYGDYDERFYEDYSGPMTHVEALNGYKPLTRISTQFADSAKPFKP